MNLINEIITVSILIIIIYIMFYIISDFIRKKLNKSSKENIDKSKIKNIKNICILIIGIVAFATIIDIYNE